MIKMQLAVTRLLPIPFARLDVAYVSPDATQEAPGLLQELLGENADPVPSGRGHGPG